LATKPTMLTTRHRFQRHVPARPCLSVAWRCLLAHTTLQLSRCAIARTPALAPAVSLSPQGAAAAERAELADMLHMRYAHQLFAAGDHDGAFAHFGMVSAASPLVLLRLFPSLAPRALLESVRPNTRGAALASEEW